MATRFYLTASSSKQYVPAISPNPDAAWQETASLVRRRARTMYDYGTPAAFANVTATSTATTPELHINAQYISDPLEAQTITGTLTGQVRCVESATAGTGTIAVGVRVINDAGSVRGTLLSVVASTGSAAPPDYAASLTNRPLVGASSSTLNLSSVAAVAGDRIVIELGTRDVDTSTSRTYSLNFGASSSAGDLPADSTTTTASAPWVEFSQTLVFMSLRPPRFDDGATWQRAIDIIASGPMPGD